MAKSDHTAEEILSEKLARIRDARRYAEEKRKNWTARIQTLDTEEARILAGLDILEARAQSRIKLDVQDPKTLDKRIKDGELLF